MKPNSIVSTLLKQDAPAISELTGYVGQCDKKTVRVFRDFGLEAHVDLPAEAVLHFSEAADPTHRSRIFFNRTAILKYATSTRGFASSLVLSGSVTASMDEIIRVTREIAAQSSQSCSCSQKEGEVAALGQGPLGIGPSCGAECEQISNSCPYGDDWCRIECYYCFEKCKRDNGTYDVVGTAGLLAL